MKDTIVRQQIYTDQLDKFYGQGCKIDIEQQCIVDNQAITHIKITDNYGWQELIVKQTPDKDECGFGTITFDIVGNYESKALAQAFIEIGKAILDNYNKYC